MKKLVERYRFLLLWFDRALSHDSMRQILILVALLAGVFIASFALLSLSGSDWIDYCRAHDISKWIFPLYLLIDGNAFNDFYNSSGVSPTTVFVASLIYVAGVVIFTGMLISVLTNIIERRVDAHLHGQIHYLRSGHYVILGYDDTVPSFVKYIFGKSSKAYVLIMTSAEATAVTEELRKVFSEHEMKRIIVNYGHRTTADAFSGIYIEAAAEVFVVGNHKRSAHDAVNVECVDGICSYLERNSFARRPSRLTCVFNDLDTYSAFKTTEIFGRVKALGIEFVPYNHYAGWAKQVFVKRSYWGENAQGQPERVAYPAVFGKGITADDPRFVHLVFVGTTNFAVAFAMEAAHVLHFPNFVRDSRLRTRITFIDTNADKEKDEFITRNRHFFDVQSYRYQDLSADAVSTTVDIVRPAQFADDGDFLDVEFEFIKGDAFSTRVQQEIGRWAEATDEQYLSIFLAMTDQRANFALGMNMPEAVYANAVNVFIRQDRSDNFVTNLRRADSKMFDYNTLRDGRMESKQRSARHAHIFPFGMDFCTYSADNKSLFRAKLINYLYSTCQDNRFVSEETLDAIPQKELWRAADDLWRPLDVAYKWSNLYNSYTIKTKLATLRAMRGLGIDDESRDLVPLSDDEAALMAQVEHNRWNVEKLLMGYRKARPEEDKYRASNSSDAELLRANRRLFVHHDIRPYRELDSIRELDKEFSRYIPWIMRMERAYVSQQITEDNETD